MTASIAPKPRNQLLSSLSSDTWYGLAPHLQAVSLPRGFVIASEGQPFDHVYFPDAGVASITLQGAGGLVAEAGMVGWEGFLPTVAAVGGTTSMHDTFMQLAGHGFRIERDAFQNAIDADRGFERTLCRYGNVFSTQVSYTAVSNAANKVDVRLARWLLMCHDRVDGDAFSITHQHLSLMLAVRRATVTITLHELEGRRLIRSERNQVTIRNRAALEAYAGGAYGGPEREYQMLLGDPSGIAIAEDQQAFRQA